MVTSSKVVSGAQVVSAGVRKTIQSIKEIVGNHSDTDIYVALKEANMDPNETTQKLLNQDPFHEVKRKRDRKKEPPIAEYKSFVAPEPRRNTELVRIPVKNNTYSDHEAGRNTELVRIPVKNNTYSDHEPGKNTELVRIPVKNNTYSDQNFRRGGYGRNTASGANREFRVVRDNRVNQNACAVSKPSRSSILTGDMVISSESTKSSSTETSGHQDPPVGQHSSRASNNPADQQPKQIKAIRSAVNDTNPTSRVPAKTSAPPPCAASTSVVGVYSSNSDPVHVPSLHPRPSANIGAIRREVGVVGPRRQSSENSSKSLSSQSATLPPNTQSGRDGKPRESTKQLNTISKSDQLSKNIVPDSAVHGLPASKSFSSNHYGIRPHQPMGHQKASQSNKEWKPKASVKPKSSGPAKTVSPPENSDVLKNQAAQVQDNKSQLKISEIQNVTIAPHIRVSETDRCRLTFGSLRTELETDRCRLTFGSLGIELDASTNSLRATAEAEETRSTDPSGSVSVSAPEYSADEMIDDSNRRSGSNSPASGVAVLQPTQNKESSVQQKLDNHVDVGLVRHSNPTYTREPLEQQQQDTSGYDPQMGYDISYFRPIVSETVRGTCLPQSQEVVSSHTTNGIPASTIAMVQQQQQQLAQMYPQLHVSHFMPYRQFLSPVYVPPMPVSGYSNSPAYPHPSNGNNYVLMPGNSSHHLNASGVKYGVQQFKPVPAGSATGFANFTSPAGYAMSASVVGGHDDASRLKYKDNLYVPNPQAETSEIWMNPRDLQSGSYYNMPGQTPHPTYLTSHNGHASSHIQFPGMYHPPPQPGAIGGGTAGVGVAAPGPGGQVGAYQQQPQLGHLNWTGNF